MFNFLTIFIYVYVYVWMCVKYLILLFLFKCMCVCEWVCVMYECPQMPEEGIQSSGPGARDDCKPLDMSARNHTWVFSQILSFTPALGLLCDAKQRPTESSRESHWQLSSIRSVPNVQLANLFLKLATRLLPLYKCHVSSSIALSWLCFSNQSWWWFFASHHVTDC